MFEGEEYICLLITITEYFEYVLAIYIAGHQIKAKDLFIVVKGS